MGNRHKRKWVEEVPNTGNKPPFFSKRKVTVISVLVIVILLSVWDIFIDPPAWWRSGRQRDKKAILEYVEDNYPATIRKKGGKFPLQMPAGPFEHSVMFFELDGVNFDVSAWKGKITGDTYYEAKAEKYIRENFIDGFMNERGLSPKIKISFIMPQDYYGLLQKYILDDIYCFTGSVGITITQAYIDGVSTPKDVGWFYDFYQYWMDNCDLPNCTVNMYYRRNNDYSTNETDYNIWFNPGKRTFSDENDFYNHFTT